MVQVIQSGPNELIGSGVWIDEGGYIATCLHLVTSDSTPIRFIVRSAVDAKFDLPSGSKAFGNWQIFQADVVAKDSQNDIAILKVSPNPFKTPQPIAIKINGANLSAHYDKADLDVDLPLPGEAILIAGYPLGQPYLVFQEGTVASIAVLDPLAPPKILLSAVANRGNSGGPVFNDRGKVIGLLEGEMDGVPERTGLELVVPAFFVDKLMKSIQQQQH